jgi:hypothetical protein
MDIDSVLDKLMAAGVDVWLDGEGKLRIDKDATADLKQLVREHKQELTDVRRAQGILNGPKMRGIRLPLGQFAVAHPLGADLEEIRWAMRVLGMDGTPLVINDEGFEWISYEEWRRRDLVRIMRGN